MSQEAKPRGNPIVERLKGKGRVQQFSGYVGIGPDEKVELYSDLSLRTCLEIDRQDVLHVEDGEKPTQPSMVFVREDAPISVRNTTTAKALAEMGEDECHCSPSEGEDEDEGYLAAMIGGGGLGATGKACKKNKTCKDKCMKKDPFVRQGCMDSCDVSYPCRTSFGGSGGGFIIF
jgi:hypothetical protein